MTDNAQKTMQKYFGVLFSKILSSMARIERQLYFVVAAFKSLLQLMQGDEVVQRIRRTFEGGEKDKDKSLL